MVPLLKVAAIGAAGAGLCCLGWWISNYEGIPSLRDLSTDSDFNTGEGGAYKNKYASDYSKYFVGVGTSTTSSIDNSVWWEWVLKNRYQTYSSIKKQGFTNKNTAEELKTACKNAYQADPGKVKESASATDEYEESNVWIFCSIGGNKPKALSEVDAEKNAYGDSSFGKNDKDKTLLISTKDSNNDWFWNIKEVEFFGASSYPTDLGDGNSNDSTFKKAFGNKEQYKDFTHFQVKKMCGEAYKQNSQSAVAFPRKVVFKFCSLSGKEPQVEKVSQTETPSGVDQAGKQQTEGQMAETPKQ